MTNTAHSATPSATLLAAIIDMTTVFTTAGKVAGFIIFPGPDGWEAYDASRALIRHI
jgi:hypothetical protein